MTTQTEIKLQDKLVVLNAEQYQAIFALYGQEGLDKYDSLVEENAKPEVFQTELASFIETDSNQEQKSNLTSLIDKYFENYNNEKNKLDELADAAKKANKAKDGFKKAFNGTIATFTETCEKLVSGENKRLLDQRKRQKEADSAWEKREKIRQRGIDAYLRGVVAAVIDDMEEKYREEANEKADKISQIANAQVEALDEQVLIEPKSKEGTDKILRHSFPRKRSNTVKAAKSASSLIGNDNPKPVSADSNEKKKGFAKN